MTIKTDPNKKIGAVMVIGSGIAGMQASLDLAESGFKTYLIEELSAIGGRMPQLDKTFPTNECAMCVVSPKIVDCGRHTNIEILTDSTVSKLEGTPGNFKVTLNKRSRFIDMKKCNACGECEKVCPVQIKSVFDRGIGLKHPIYRLYPQAVPSAYTITKAQEKPPCRISCPANINVQGYIALTTAGKYKEAYDLIRYTVPFPGVLGRICYHPCETQCNRKEVDEPSAINPIKRFVSDFIYEERKSKYFEDKGTTQKKTPYSFEKNITEELWEKRHAKKVAVVGSGPAGLACAYDLIRLGYKVTVFEKEKKLGGMLRFGIPSYRLPRSLLDKEISIILDMGLTVKAGIEIGRAKSISQLKAEGFAAIFLGIGTSLSRELDIEGANLGNVFSGLEFLKQVNQGEDVELGEKVVVIGGGNVAIDVARCARRLGKKKVSLVCLEMCSEMPAHPWEVELALEEGLEIKNGFGPKKIIGEKGKVVGIEFKRCVKVFDEDGRFNPEFDDGGIEKLDADSVLVAIGQSAQLSLFEKSDNLKLERGLIKVDETTLETNLEGVFAGGDVVSGPSSAIESMAMGKEAAISIDRYLLGSDLREGRQRQIQKEGAPLPQDAERTKKKRVSVKKRVATERIKDFKEVELTLSEEEVLKEASRCFDCAICSECFECEKVCEPCAILHDMPDETLKIEVGAIVVTTGVELFDAQLKKEYGFGKYKNVLTSIQLERILSSSGPTEGRLLRPSDDKVPQKIAFIQCVGSRDPDYGNEFCSSVCCMYTAKQALIAREHEPEVRVKIFFIDIRAFGKGFEKYYETVRQDPAIKYQKCMISKVYEMPDTKNLQLMFIDEKGKMQEEEFEMVVLAVGLTDTSHFKKLAGIFHLESNEYSFCKTDRLLPGVTNREGIFVAGTIVEPKDIPETVIDGSSCASLASSFLSESRGELIKEKKYPPVVDVSEEDLRIGVFVCRCGRNIASVVDVPEVVKHACQLPGVVYAKEFLYSCSQDSLMQLKKDILDNSINRVVVASCTPRTHEELFRDTIREVGLNRYLFDMTSLREHVSWVHAQQKERATEKAKELVAMMAAKVRVSYPIEQTAYEVTSKCLVVGGGISGMQASLNLARNGYEVFLVEKEERLGGNLLRLKKNLEGGDLSIFLAKLISQVENQKNIRLFKKSKVKGVTGFLGNFKTKIEELETNHITEVTHGAVIIAIGAKEYKLKEFAYGASPHIITQLELEKEITTIADTSNFRPQTFVMIQCVGSRNEEHPYCSRFCCAQAVKNALELKNLSPQHKVFILYRDMRTFGFSEKFYLEAREKGVLFNRFCQEMPPEVKVMQDGKIRIIYYDTILSEEINIDADWLILTTGVVACQEAKEISELFKIPTDADGFFMEAHAKIRPVDCSTEGIFLCGLCHSPQFVHESLAQAQAAAARAITILSKKKIESKGIIVKVNERVCKSCGVCVSVCPYSAREINEETGVAAVHEILCQGCGACAVACPSGATEHKGFNKNQLMSMVEGSI